ncbi:MAG TPA: amidohydrolase family protein [Sedimentisphaerales bacterium]|nr:amidohydrolase family protein [Sedimentisphaerales bacterium]
MDGIIDFHAHAFPDNLAQRAMKALCDGAPDATAFHNGTIGGLLKSMDAAGIERAVICNIATRPSQFEPILRWSGEIASKRIIPFCSIHPNDPDALAHISAIKDAGFKGIKMHAYYQDFHLDEPRMMPIYERISREGLILVAHCGYDIAFERFRRADPPRIRKVTETFPDLKFIAAHLGAWQQWDEVAALLAGRPIYMDLSFALECLPPDEARAILMEHNEDYLLWGTDSPWTDQSNALRLLRNLDLPSRRLEKMLRLNGERLLAMQ